jgi:hypothetical protein
METRKLAVALVAFINALQEASAEFAEALEKQVSADGDGDDPKPARSSRAGKTGGKDTSKTRGKDKDDDGDEPSEDDMVDAVRGAQKVLESADIKKILKKHGKAERASEIEPENRQAAIDALEKAVEAAE